MKALITIRDLLVRRAQRDALVVEALDVRRGEVLAVVGPNGAGKSTLLLALARLLRPAHGQILFEGRSLDQWNDVEYRRRLSIVLQDPLLVSGSVFDNVSLGLRFRGLARAEIRERVVYWLEQLEIGHLATRPVNQLSGGEAQRVSLARAFILEPELLLLDEPFASLDPPTRAKLLDDLARLLADDHRTAIFVTHNLKEAAQFGDRLAVMIGGALRQVGPARQIKSKPADEAVAAFLREIKHKNSSSASREKQ
jgi:tungstate transport system ATP-binding protein